MGSVVGIRWRCCNLNSKRWAQVWKRRGLLCSSKSLFRGDSHWDQSTSQPNDREIQSLTEKETPLFYLSGKQQRWSRMQSVTGARAPPWVAAKAWRDEAVFSAEGHWVCVWRWRSSSGEASCLLLFSRMGTLLERRARQQGWSESSRLSTLHVSETVHRASLALRADRPPAL